MENDKWVWADEEELRPQSLPLLDKQMTPIVEWADLELEPQTPEQAPELPAPSLISPLAPPPQEIAAAPLQEEPAPPPTASSTHPSVSGSGREITPSVVKAIVLHLEGKIEDAIVELQAGIRNGEPAAELFTAMGALQMELDRYEDAAASYREVLLRDPSHEISQHHLALCHERIKEAKKPKTSPSVVKAIVLHMEKKLDEAIKELQRGIKAGEQTEDVFSALGHLQFEVGRFDAAAEAYAEVLKREPAHRTCHYNLAVCLEKLGRHKEALASFQKAFEINSQRVEMGIGIGVSLLHLRRFTDAVSAFETCLQTHPDDPAALFGKAFALQGASRLEEAEAAYHEALRRDPSQEEALMNLIAVSLSRGKSSALHEYCATLLALRPESRIALEALMTADLAAGNFQAAADHGEKLTRIAADSFEAWFNYGIACHGMNRADDAAAAFMKATRIRPKSVEAFSSLAHTLQSKGDLAGAKSAYESALKLSPDNTALIWNLMLIAEQTNTQSDAEKFCETLAAKSPESEAVQFRLGSFRFRRNDFAGSADAFRLCVKAKSDWPAAQLNLGLSLWKSGNTQEASSHLEKVTQPPFSNDAWRHLAAIAAEREDYSAALDFYQRLSDAGERSPELFYNTGIALQHLGRLEEAVKHHREALAMNPELSDATQALLQLSNATGRSTTKKEEVGPRLVKSGT